MAMGRPQKPFKTSWGDLIVGLYKCPDGRWRINGTGQKFTEANERRAVERFREISGTTSTATTAVQISLGDVLADCPKRVDDLAPAHVDRLTKFYDDVDAAGGELADVSFEGDLENAPMRLNVPDEILWPWLAKLLDERPEYVAKMTGNTSLLNLPKLKAQPKRIKLDDLLVLCHP